VTLGRGQRVQGGAGAAAGEGQHPADTGVGRQRVTQPDQECGDTAVVPGAGAAEVMVDVGVQEELGDGQTGPGHDVVGGVTAQVDRGKPGDGSQVAVGRAEVFDQCHCGGFGGAVAQGGDGGQPDGRVLGGVDGELQQRAAGDRTGHEAEGLDQPAADGRIGCPCECAFDGQRDLQRRGVGPSGERALGENTGEATAHDDPDQPADRIEAGQPGLERPARVLAQERPGV
jgi:hypothetical protein